MWQSVWLRWRMWDSAVGLSPPGSDLMCLWSPSGSISLWDKLHIASLSQHQPHITKQKNSQMSPKKVLVAVIEAAVTNWAPVISLYTAEGLSCWPANTPCQQISLVTGAGLLFSLWGVCAYVWASAKDLQIARRAGEFIYRPSVTAAQGQQQQVIYIQCTRVRR